jgi:hypothetical protein
VVTGSTTALTRRSRCGARSANYVRGGGSPAMRCIELTGGALQRVFSLSASLSGIDPLPRPWSSASLRDYPHATCGVPQVRIKRPEGAPQHASGSAYSAPQVRRRFTSGCAFSAPQHDSGSAAGRLSGNVVTLSGAPLGQHEVEPRQVYTVPGQRQQQQTRRKEPCSY